VGRGEVVQMFVPASSRLLCGWQRDATKDVIDLPLG
jgi:hypothetical protein